MILPQKRLVLGLVVLFAAVVGLLVLRPASRFALAPAPAVASAPAPAFVSISPPMSPVLIRSAIPPPADPIEATLAAFATKLRALQEVETGDLETAGRLTRELLALLTDANVEDMVKSLSPSELDTPFGLGAIRHWMRVDPLLAAAWLGARPDKNDQHLWIVAQELARNPESLDHYAASFADDPWKQAILHHAGRELADRDPRKALALGSLLPAGDAQTDLLETTLYSWAHADHAAAARWLAGRPESPLRERLSAILAKALAVKTSAVLTP